MLAITVFRGNNVGCWKTTPRSAPDPRTSAPSMVTRCRFRKLYPFDSQSPTNQNMIAECLQSASYWSVCCATSSSRDRGWKVYPNTLVRYARVARKSPQTAECVVGEGVFLEPVSPPALTGKRTGNF